MKKQKIFYITLGIFVSILLIVQFFPFNSGHTMSMDEKRENFIELKTDMQGDLLSQGQYRCCLMKPCTYCIEKTPKHGEGAACDCLEDIVNGMAPCGECIGEILEGHGNPYLSEYFAKAIAEEVGMENLPTLEKIIEQKYERR